MGYPVVRNTSSGETGNVTGQAIPLPSGIVSGDLLVMFVSVDGSHTFAAISGWTQLAQSNSGGQNSFGIWYKIATGSDANPTASWGAKEQGTYAVSCFEVGTFTGVPQITALTSGTSAAPDSNAITPSWGLYNTRFMSVVGTDAITSVTTQPSGYAVAIDVSTSSGQGASLSTCFKNANLASDNPGAYLMNASEQWIAYTIAIQGTEAVADLTLMNVYLGTWQAKPLKRYDGADWVGTKTKRWTGSIWELL